MSSKDEITPIRKQYLDIKRQYPDTIVFFRLGDFYETFDQDAEITSRELDIVLTSRNVAKGTRIPMAGIPHHAVDNYLSRLIDRGFHVAICEQVGDQPVQGLFPRQVVRVVTPGTLTEPGLLPGDANNYLACMAIEEDENEKRSGLAYVDISTGEFAVTEFAGSDLFDSLRSELVRLNPAEVILPDTQLNINGFPGHPTFWPAWRFEIGKCREALLRHFQAASLDGFGLRDFPLAVRAAGVIIQYLADTQPAALKLLTRVSTYTLSDFMVLDSSTRRNLELTETIRGNTKQGSLLGVLDHTVTPMGSRLIRQWVSKPLLDIQEITCRQDELEIFFKDGLLRAEFFNHMKHLGDLERFSNRILSASAIPRDLVAIRNILEKIPAIKEALPLGCECLGKMVKDFDVCSDVLHLLENALTDDSPATLNSIGVIRAGFSAELDGVLERSRHAREWIANLEGSEKQRTGIKTLKVGYNKVFGYYIEITRANADSAPENYIRKQTLVNAERYITSELKEYETLVLNAEDRIREIESRIFKEICGEISHQASRLLTTSQVLAQLDVLVSLGETAAQNGYIRPVVVAEDILDIRDGRHPVVELNLSGERFVPNDTHFKEGERIQIITGPNMSGKSTYLRQVALIALLAQMGSFVPASHAKIGIIDRIFTRIGAQDEIHAGHSTFMVEMVETANILHHATNRSLLILDEIGRGTSTYDGVSIAWAVVEYIHNHPKLRSKTLFATHYHELTQLSELLPGVNNWNVAVSESEGRVVFLHKIVPGGADRSYGIHVGQLAGLPRPVIQRAGEILQQLEASSGKAIKIDPNLPKQLALFPKTNPLLDELYQLDLNVFSPIEALNKLYEWRNKFLREGEFEP